MRKMKNLSKRKKGLRSRIPKKGPEMKVKNRSKGVHTCAIHSNKLAITTCSKCGENMCTECTSLSEFPHVCPNCFPQHYEEKMVKRSRMKKGSIVVVVSVVAIIALMILIPWSYSKLYDAAFDRDEPTPDELKAEGYAYLDDSDIYPEVTANAYNAIKNTITFDFWIYVTNEGDFDYTLRVELMLIKNTTIRDEIDSDDDAYFGKPIIDANQSHMYEFRDVTVKPGTYFAIFMMWKDYKIYRYAKLSITVDKEGVQNVLRHGEQALNNVDPYAWNPPARDDRSKAQVAVDHIEGSFKQNFWILITGLVVISIAMVIVGLVVFIPALRKKNYVYYDRKTLTWIKENFGLRDLDDVKHIAPTPPPQPQPQAAYNYYHYQQPQAAVDWEERSSPSVDEAVEEDLEPEITQTLDEMEAQKEVEDALEEPSEDPFDASTEVAEEPEVTVEPQDLIEPGGSSDLSGGYPQDAVDPDTEEVIE